MKLLGNVVFFLAVLCVCTVGENGTSTSTVNSTISALTTKPVAEVNGVNATTSQTTRLQMPVPTVTAARASNETITSSPTSSLPNATSRITQGTTTRTPAVTSTANKCSSTTNTTKASATQLAQHESLNASSTMRWSSPSTVSPERNTSASGTSGLPVNSPTNLTNPASGSHGSGSANKDDPGSNIPYSNVILPIVVTLVIITLSVFSLVALYKMCQKKTPERQENGAEQAQSDKEGVKLLSVKTTSPETVFVEVCDIYEVGFSLPSANLSEPTTPPPSGEVSQGRTTGEHSSQGKNKTRQLFTSQQ